MRNIAKCNDKGKVFEAPADVRGEWEFEPGLADEPWSSRGVILQLTDKEQNPTRPVPAVGIAGTEGRWCRVIIVFLSTTTSEELTEWHLSRQ